MSSLKAILEENDESKSVVATNQGYCLQYRDTVHLECPRSFPGMEDYRAFNPENFSIFIQDRYGSRGYLGSNTPFVFSEDNIDKTAEDICGMAKDFSLTPPQKFIGQFVSPYTRFRGLLVFHKMGAGKTCSAIVCGEGFKNVLTQGGKIPQRSPSKVIISLPAQVEKSFYDEILGRLSAEGNIVSCTGDCIIAEQRQTYIDPRLLSVITRKKKRIEFLEKKRETVATQRERSALTNTIRELKSQLPLLEVREQQGVKVVYQIMSHHAFVRKIGRKDGRGRLIIEGPLLEEFKKPNTLLIIDEVQNLISATGIWYRSLLYAIQYHSSPDLKLLLLSGSPLYDKPYELGYTLNLLRPRLRFPDEVEDFNRLFVHAPRRQDRGDAGRRDDDGGELERLGKSGLGDEAYSVLEREIQERRMGSGMRMKNKDLFKYMCNGYVSYFSGGNPVAFPAQRLIIQYHRFAEGTPQWQGYLGTIPSEAEASGMAKDKPKQIHALNAMFSGQATTPEAAGYFTQGRKYCNIVFPTPKARSRNSPLEILINALKKLRYRLVQEKAEEKGIVAQVESIQDLHPDDQGNIYRTILDTAKAYSQKLPTIVEHIMRSRGTVFVYSNWKAYGVTVIAKLLELVGFSEFKFESRIPTREAPRFTLWTGDIKKDQRKLFSEKTRGVFNNPKNKDGGFLKVVLGTQAIMEGISFKNVRQVHIVDPWWNDSRTLQVVARAARFCSHQDLDPLLRYVDVYYHFAILPEYPKQTGSLAERFVEKNLGANPRNMAVVSVEQVMQKVAENKRMVSRQFESALKESAVDCSLNRFGNLIRLTEVVTPFVEDGIVGNKLVYENPSTGKLYMREGLERILTEEEIEQRHFSIPRDPDAPRLSNKFVEIVRQYEDGIPSYQLISTGKIYRFPSNLIVSEDILCDSVRFSPGDIPESLHNVTNNNKLLPYLLTKSKRDIVDCIIALRTKAQRDPRTPFGIRMTKALKKLLTRDEAYKKAEIVRKIVEDSQFAEYAGDGIFLLELLSLRELRSLYKLRKG